MFRSRLVRRALLVSLAAGVFAALLIGAGALYVYLDSRSDFDRLLAILERPAGNTELVFLDQAGAEFDRHSTGGRVYLPLELEDVDPEFIQDLLAVEDRNFRTHGGVDYTATLYAAYNYLGRFFTNQSPGEGPGRRGGSTISQQLVKLLLEYPPRTVFQKLKELTLAWRLEHEIKSNPERFIKEARPPRPRIADGEVFSPAKKFILERYLGEIYVAERIRGLEAGARIFLKQKNPPGTKPPTSRLTQLNSDERVLLLGLIHAPGILHSNSPRSRQNLLQKIKYRLRTAGRPTEEKSVDRPKKTGIDSIFTPRPEILSRRKSLINALPDHRARTPLARSLLSIRYARHRPRGTNYIQTARISSLDQQMGERLQEYIQAINKTGIGPRRTAAYILVRLKDGAVISMSDDPATEFNEAITLRRQIHSTIKPFLYAAAFDQLGLSPASIFRDHRFVFITEDGVEYAPGNTYRIFKGDLTLKSALQYSSNTVSLQLFQKLGPAPLIKVGRQAFRLRPSVQETFGFHPHPSLALGTVEMSPAQLSSAYLSLLTGGEKRYLKFETPGTATRSTPASRTRTNHVSRRRLPGARHDDVCRANGGHRRRSGIQRVDLKRPGGQKRQRPGRLLVRRFLRGPFACHLGRLSQVSPGAGS